MYFLFLFLPAIRKLSHCSVCIPTTRTLRESCGSRTISCISSSDKLQEFVFYWAKTSFYCVYQGTGRQGPRLVQCWSAGLFLLYLSGLRWAGVSWSILGTYSLMGWGHQAAGLTSHPGPPREKLCADSTVGGLSADIHIRIINLSQVAAFLGTSRREVVTWTRIIWEAEMRGGGLW